MRITLLGLEFASANMGCEALAYSFVNKLSKAAKELGVELEYTAVLFDLKPNVKVPCSGQEIQCLKIRYKSIKFWTTLLKVFKKSDMIFDFTGGDSFSDIYGKKRFYMATLIKILAIKSKTPFILGPQTYGPYQRRLVKILAKKVIRESAEVFARDDVSRKFAADLANREVKIAADVAFALPYEKGNRQKDNAKIRIGINPSGLLWNGGYSHAKLPLTVEYQRYCTDLLECLVSDDRYEIYLITHVGTKNTGEVESDYTVCNLLHEKYPDTILVDIFDSPMVAKSFISEMDVLIAARMHATIAAFSAGVATIPFSYSRKFEGLYNSVNYDYVIHAISQETDEAVAKTISYINEYKRLQSEAKEAMQKIYLLQSDFEKELKKLISENMPTSSSQS